MPCFLHTSHRVTGRLPTRRPVGARTCATTKPTTSQVCPSLPLPFLCSGPAHGFTSSRDTNTNTLQGLGTTRAMRWNTTSTLSTGALSANLAQASSTTRSARMCGALNQQSAAIFSVERRPFHFAAQESKHWYIFYSATAMANYSATLTSAQLVARAPSYDGPWTVLGPCIRAIVPNACLIRSPLARCDAYLCPSLPFSPFTSAGPVCEPASSPPFYNEYVAPPIRHLLRPRPT